MVTFQEWHLAWVKMHSEAMLLKFAFLILTLATSSALGEFPSNSYVPGIGCDPSPNICEVTCPPEDEDECVLGEGWTDALVIDPITHGNMTQDKCQELCKASDAAEEANRCRFWRYVSPHFP